MAQSARASTAIESGVRITQAWIRWLPANLPAGGYLTLINERDTSIALVAVHSPVYDSIELHRTRIVDGTARMLPVGSIRVAAHSQLDLATQGYHLMLMQARTVVKPGQTLPLTLQFADGGVLQVTAQVKPPATQPSETRATGGTSSMPDMPGMPGMSH